MTATMTKQTKQTKHAKMTSGEYAARRKQIDEQVEAREELVDAYCDQMMSKLFVDCEWTLEEIAEREGKKKSWVSYRVCFGRFVEWANRQDSTARGIPKNLTEYRFRSYWEQTTGTKDTARFRKVLRMMQDETVVCTPREQTRVEIEKHCKPGDWYTTQEVAKATGLTEVQVDKGFYRLRAVGLCQRENTAQGQKYNIRKGEGRTSLDVAVLRHTVKEAEALIRNIIRSATGEDARYSATGVALDAGKLKYLMSELKKRITPGSA